MYSKFHNRDDATVLTSFSVITEFAPRILEVLRSFLFCKKGDVYEYVMCSFPFHTQYLNQLATFHEVFYGCLAIGGYSLYTFQFTTQLLTMHTRY